MRLLTTSGYEWPEAAEVARLLRENEALRALLVPNGLCDHNWTTRMYHLAGDPHDSFRMEYECLRCLRRAPI